MVFLPPAPASMCCQHVLPVCTGKKLPCHVLVYRVLVCITLPCGSAVPHHPTYWCAAQFYVRVCCTVSWTGRPYRAHIEEYSGAAKCVHLHLHRHSLSTPPRPPAIDSYQLPSSSQLSPELTRNRLPPPPPSASLSPTNLRPPYSRTPFTLLRT